MDGRGAAYVVGVDLGQSQDPTAIAVVRRVVAANAADALDRLFDDAEHELYQVGHLERLPLGTSYPAIVGHVKALIERLPRGAELVIDFGGVGRPVFDLFHVAGLEALGVLITGGSAESGAYPIWSVPKLNLVSGVQTLLHEERLKIHRGLPDAPALVKELQDFRVDFSASGHMQFSARSGAHDDLVLALAIGVWRARTGGAPPLLTYMRAQAQTERRADAKPLGLARAADDDPLPWRKARNIIADDAIELNQLYLDTLDGILPTDGQFCATCNKPLGVTKHTDGVFRWHPECGPPRQ